MGAPLYEPFGSLLAAATREIGLFAIAGLLIGGIDDLAVDLLWIGRGVWRALTVFRRNPRATMASLAPPRDPGRIAIFVPAWREADVIGAMLRAALARIAHDDYRIYVGTYPNDPETARQVTRIGDPRIRLVRGDVPGPTTKAECLNRLWRAMLADERGAGRAFKAIVLHDAEDVIHPQELALYDRMIERFDLVQVPVVPIASSGDPMPHDRSRLRGLVRRGIARIVSRTYCDEFAEAHGKQLAVREAVGAGLPSAGVGCAIARAMLARVAERRGGLPFDAASLTEDYEMGLAVRTLGGRGALVSIPAGPGLPIVAVHAHFPDTFETAIRQKARWITGIALAGWDRLRWEGGLAERWMRLRDRRAMLAALLMMAAYAAMLLSLLCHALAVAVAWPPLALRLFDAASGLLVWRLGLRAIVVGRWYGFVEGLASIPRSIVGNFIDTAAAWRAIRRYVPGALPHWDKTTHRFPDELSCG